MTPTSMSNIGIITFHRSYNYGSVLQAYALQTQVQELGYNAQVIDFTMEKDFEQYKLFRTHLYKKQPKSLGADIAFFLPHLKRMRNFERFIAKRLNLTKHRYTKSEQMKELNDSMDAFICGGDQIWNLDCTGGIEPAFFLDFATGDKRKIAYAPSMAHATFSLDNKTSSELISRIGRLDAVSIREETNLPYLQDLLPSRQVAAVLDPTLLLNRRYYDDLIPSNHSDEKSIFVYMLEWNQDLIRYAEDIQKKTGYKLYYISQKVNCGFSTGTNCFGMAPEEFLGHINSAEYVITNSFHATVFSILFHKQFCVFPTKKSSARMLDLLRKLGLQNRIIWEGFDIAAPIDYRATEVFLGRLREDSLNYLRAALNGRDRNENSV